MTHSGRAKCIYIDPPCNTGNKGWVNSDDYVDREDRNRKLTWLEFLFRRLTLARDLLAEDGVLLVSINDDQRAKLELLLDDALPGMRVGSIVWRSRQGSNADQDYFLSGDHEHVLAYAKLGFGFNGSEKPLKIYSNPDNDPRGQWTSGDLTLGFSGQERPNLFYPLHDPNKDIWYPCNPNGVWRYASTARLKHGQRIPVFVKQVFRRFQAASLISEALVSRSGFSQTCPAGCQLRVFPDHRSGFCARAFA